MAAKKGGLNFLYAKPHEFHSYNGAGHVFQNFLDATLYRERPARGSWSEMLVFFAQHRKA